MNTGEILDRTFNLYRNNFMLFAGIAVLPPALYLALNVSQLIITQIMMDALGQSSQQQAISAAPIG
jgi:hypothetical protein